MRYELTPEDLRQIADLAERLANNRQFVEDLARASGAVTEVVSDDWDSLDSLESVKP